MHPTEVKNRLHNLSFSFQSLILSKRQRYFGEGGMFILMRWNGLGIKGLKNPKGVDRKQKIFKLNVADCYKNIRALLLIIHARGIHILTMENENFLKWKLSSIVCY